MSVSRRASFAAGIAAVRRDRLRNQQRQQQQRLSDSPYTPSSPYTETPVRDSSNTITVVAGPAPQSAQLIRGSNLLRQQPASASPVVPEKPVNKPTKQQLSAGHPVMALEKSATAFAAVAKAATVATRKPRIQNEVRAFTRESLEKINIRTNNLIRDYGFLPKRSPNLQDGAQLPAKYEPFPQELLGRPVEELDQYVYEKVGLQNSRNFIYNVFYGVLSFKVSL